MRVPVPFKHGAHRVNLVAFAAVEAMGVGGVAVQLDHLPLRHAAGLMQAIDVLGDDR